MSSGTWRGEAWLRMVAFSADLEVALDLRPTVDDEIDNGLRFFRAALFDAVPQTLRAFEAAVKRVYGSAARDFQAPAVWVGGVFDSCWVVSNVASTR
jgi:phosphoenolpyruvate carboxylase